MIFRQAQDKEKQKLSREEILHLAKLAKIKLTDEEIERFQEQLSDIVEYIKKLNQLDTKDTEAISQTTDLVNVTREDNIDTARLLSQKDVLRNAKANKNGFIKVQAIFDR